jgi:hypothetical protein
MSLFGGGFHSLELALLRLLALLVVLLAVVALPHDILRWQAMVGCLTGYSIPARFRHGRTPGRWQHCQPAGH